MDCAALRDREIRLRTDVEQHEKKAGIAFINFATLFRDADGIDKRRRTHRASILSIPRAGARCIGIGITAGGR